MSLLGDFSTIAEMFRTVIAECSESQRDAFLVKHHNDSYHGVSYSAFAHDVRSIALGLRSLGISRGDHLGIMSENRIEWMITDFACACSGIADVPVFPILTPHQISYIFNDAAVVAVVCSNKFQFGKLQKVIDEIPSLRHIILMQEDGLEDVLPETLERVKVHTFVQIKEEGAKLVEAASGQFDELIERVKPDDLLTLIYTSGTTGHPKGVMLTHRNLVSNIQGAARVLSIDTNDVVLSYLPLCHAFERMAGYYTCFACGATIGFAESIDTVVTNLSEVRPTVMTTVPRFLERFKSRVESQARAKSERDQKVFHWAMKVGRKRVQALQKKGKVGSLLSLKYGLADKLVFSKIRERMGGRMRFFASGGAALPRDVAEFIFSIGLNVVEGYGLTEASPVIAVNPLEKPIIGTVGPPISNVEVRIADDGEILARGENIMQGYYNDPGATAETIDEEGWLHTGDIGEFDRNHYLRITDRKKHIFVASNGKNIAPGPIEDLLGGSQLISQIMLIGDDRPYLSALIVPDFDALVNALREAGGKPKKPNSAEARQELASSEATSSLIESDIRRLQHELSAFERVRRFTILPEEFSVENGMMTPTLKIKRKEVMKQYEGMIEEMYPGGGD